MDTTLPVLATNVFRVDSLPNENIASGLTETLGSRDELDQLVSVVHLLLSSALPLHQVSLKLWVFEKNQSLLLAPENSGEASILRNYSSSTSEAAMLSAES